MHNAIAGKSFDILRKIPLISGLAQFVQNARLGNVNHMGLPNDMHVYRQIREWVAALGKTPA